jgi:hypothetical protein
VEDIWFSSGRLSYLNTKRAFHGRFDESQDGDCFLAVNHFLDISPVFVSLLETPIADE